MFCSSESFAIEFTQSLFSRNPLIANIAKKNFEFYENGRLKNYTRQILVILGKNKIHKSQFSDEFCSVAAPAPPP
jgi:hypothetical protein